MYEVDMPVEVAGYIEQLEYELSGLRNLVVFAERSKQDDESFERIYGRYREKFCERQTAMEEARAAYVPKEYQTRDYRFRIDYPACRLVIEPARAEENAHE